MLLMAVLAAGLALLPPAHSADPPIRRVGAGSYRLGLPPGAAGPPAEIYRTENTRGPMPTNGWWSSLAWVRYSEPQYPHPLAVQETGAGLRVYYPGPGITTNASGVFGAMPAPGSEDLLLGHSAQPEFPDARVDGFSDWFVRARLGDAQHGLSLTYGHGSPYVYATFAGGSARLKFPKPPTVWSGDERSPVLGITTNGRHYGLFGPAGSTWTGLGTTELVNHTAKTYFSLAVLPDNSPRTLALFAKYAHSHVTDSRVAWKYDPASATVTTTYAFTTTPREGSQAGTLFALYPHQWSHTGLKLTPHTYASVRGTMKLAEGSGFTTRMTFPGVLPVLPLQKDEDRAALQHDVAASLDQKGPRSGDTYWEGKYLGRLATVSSIAGLVGDKASRQATEEQLRERLEGWLTATDAQGAVKSSHLFAYDGRWGTLIGYPASYGSDRELNDHHFHYGYFLQAAAEIARGDRSWASEPRWGGMVRLLIRDIACPDRSDPLFPFLRNFDPYEGHTWASGHAKFGDGNNNESSSEAMNAWTGLILWGEATGDRPLRDLGIYLYTTEMEAIDEYWFDVHRRNRPAAFPGATVAMVWGGKAVPATWFSGEPEKIHGINWLPFHGGSLYLGRYPEYVQRNYDALVKETGGTKWSDWAGYDLMYEALANPADALRQLQSSPNLSIEAGNSRANLDHWVHALNTLGQIDRSVTADYPLYAVFRKGGKVTHVAYNATPRRLAVRFSDGKTLSLEPGQFATGP